MCFYCTHGAEFLALVAHLLPDGPALGAQEVAQVDGVDGGAGLLVQRGLLADPVEDVPVQGTVVVQERLHREKRGLEECTHSCVMVVITVAAAVALVSISNSIVVILAILLEMG